MRTTVTSVVSRIGTARTRIGRKSVATVVPAAFQLADRPSAASAKPRSWLPESPMKTAARAREADGGGEDEHEPVRVRRDGVDREVGARDPGERRGEAVHVVEQVEGVRHPDEPDERDRGRGDV